MRVQIDRFEDGGWAVLIPLLDGKRAFDVPSDLLPKDASPGDVFDVKFERDDEATERIASENEGLMDELLGAEGREGS